MSITTNYNVVSAVVTAANAANWGTPAAPAGTTPEQARRSTLGKAIAPRLAGGIAYANVTAAVVALQHGNSVTDAQQSALEAFCGQVRGILTNLVQNHTVCTVYNYLQDRVGGKYSRAQVREALPDYTPVHGLADSRHLRGILSSPVVAERVGMVLVEQSTNAGGRVRTGFAPCSTVEAAQKETERRENAELDSYAIADAKQDAAYVAACASMDVPSAAPAKAAKGKGKRK